MLAKLSAAAAVSLAALAYSAAPSQASEFGCKVLLCAASQNPSWRGVPYCVPPMTKLISMLKRGKSWPTCPEGGTGKPGYEPYAACPKGWSVGSSSTNSNDSQCVKRVCTTRYTYRGHDSQNDDENCIKTMARPRRANPYFFDIRNDDTKVKERFYFNLRT